MDDREEDWYLSAETVGQRLQAVRGEKSIAEFAELLGSHPQTVRNYELDKRSPDAKFLVNLRLRTGINLNWLLGDEPPTAVPDIRGIRPPIAPSDVSKDFVLLPRYSVRAGAGGGSVVEAEEVVDDLAFKRDWFQARGLRDGHAALIEVSGDSMEPTLFSGDLVLVDLSIQALADDAIYVLVADGHLKCKRLQRYFDGRVALRSDNPHYEDETLSPEAAEGLKIVGQIRWFGREL